MVLALLITVSMPTGTAAAGPAGQLAPGSSFAVTFPEMPATFYALEQKKALQAQMTVFLPTNYDRGRKHPLLIFLNGGDGGTGANPGVARALSAEQDFVCVSLPLFKVTASKAPGGITTTTNSRGRSE